MGFTREVRRVQDKDLPLERRYASLRSAVTMFSPNGFNVTFSNLASEVGVAESSRAWTDKQLSTAAGLLVASRDRYVLRKAEWDDQRRSLKSQGARTITSAEEKARDDVSWFDSISRGSRSRARWVTLNKWADESETAFAPFGPELRADLEVVSAAMPASRIETSNRAIAQYGPYPSRLEPATVVAIPYRIYNDSMADHVYESLTPTQQAMTDCLYSRSADGHTRQRHLKRIVPVEELWVIPFVVLAIGDYVVEIVQEVASGLSKLDQPHSWQDVSYRLFADHNAELIELVRQRSVRYMNCYYSSRYTTEANDRGRPQYPSFRILESIGTPTYTTVYKSQR